MIMDCLLTDPAGDVLLGPSEKRLPFKIAPGRNHPFLSLGDYFVILERSLSKDHFSDLTRAVSRRLDRNVHAKEISRLVIRSEKHGALYHVAGIEAYVEGGPVLRFALSTALSEMTRAYAAREFRALETLSHTFGYPYLPEVHFFREQTLQVRGKKVHVAQFLSDWLEDFYEWHLVRGGDGDRRACIWDTHRGPRFTDELGTWEIFRQAARILTLYYDVETSRRIYPVRHAAGDFVVRTDHRGVEVRLTTARDYAPLFEQPMGIAPRTALFYFLLDLTVRMRPDRDEGIGEPIWAGPFSVDSTVQGFMEALAAKETEGRLEAGGASAFRSLLYAFSRGEFEQAFEPLLERYRLTDPQEASLIQRHMRTHTEDLHRVIQAFR